MKIEGIPTFYTDFLELNARVSSRLSKFTDRLPSLLREAVMQYLFRLGLRPDRMTWTYSYCMLPFWIQCDLGGSVEHDCLEIAYANACLGHMVLIEDQLMDENVQPCGPGLMAANAFALEGQLRYASLFFHTSCFWDYYTPLLQKSWNDLLLERQLHIDASERLTEIDDELQKSKINSLKIAAIAVALLNRRDETVPQLLRYLEHWQLACQRLDDLVDWRLDLDAKNYTRILALAGVTGNQGADARMQEFFSSEIFGRYLDEVLDNYRVARTHCPRRDGYLDQHVADLIDKLAALRKSYEVLVQATDRLKSSFDTK